MKTLWSLAHIHLNSACKKYPQKPAIVHRGTRNIVILNSTGYQNMKLHSGKSLEHLTLTIYFLLSFQSHIILYSDTWYFIFIFSKTIKNFIVSNNLDVFFYYYLPVKRFFSDSSYFPTHYTSNKIRKTCFIIFLTYIQYLLCHLLKNSALHSFWSAPSPASSPAPQTQSFLWFYFSFVLCKLWCNLYRKKKKSVKWIFCTLQFGETNSPFSVTEKYPEGQYLLSMAHTQEPC